MDHGKLFRVLVIGGAMLSVGCIDEAAPADDAGEVSVDAATQSDAEADGAVVELEECGFCPNEICCETGEGGNATTREGMVCCWGTSC